MGSVAEGGDVWGCLGRFREGWVRLEIVEEGWGRLGRLGEACEGLRWVGEGWGLFGKVGDG